MGVETSYYTALVSQLAPLVLAPPGPTPLHMQWWLFLLEDLIWGVFFCKAAGQQFSLRGRGIFCCIPYSVVSPLLTFAAFLELMLVGSCVFVLVTALASLLHRAFAITSEVPNSQPIPNTFLHGICLCSTACHRAFNLLCASKIHQPGSQFGASEETPAWGVGNFFHWACTWTEGSLAAALSLTSSSWSVLLAEGTSELRDWCTKMQMEV